MTMSTWRFTTWHFLLIGLQCLALSQKTNAWDNATATWYDESGGNPNGGACGYGSISATAYGRMFTAMSSTFFQDGMGCGACYEVKCKSNSFCSENPIVVTVTDHCPEGGNPNWCGDGKVHFDLSREAFGAMAIKGEEDNLPKFGFMDQVLYRRVPCSYPKRNVQFSFKEGSSVWRVMLSLRDVGGPGTVTDVSIKTSNSDIFRPMVHDWGSFWYIQSTGDEFKGSYVILLENREKNQSLLCPKAIPATFNPNHILDCGAQWTSPSPSPSPLPPKKQPPPPLLPLSPRLRSPPPPPSRLPAPPLPVRFPPPPPPPSPSPPSPPPSPPPPPSPSSSSAPSEEVDPEILIPKKVGGPRSQSVRFRTRM